MTVVEVGVRLGYTPTRRQAADADRDRLRCPATLIDTTRPTSKTSPDTFARRWGWDERAARRVAEARNLAEAAVTAEATAREEAENTRIDAERRVDAAEADAAERIQTVLDEQRRALAEERQRAEEQADQLRKETATTVASAHADAAAAWTAQARAEAGQQTAEHASAEAQATVEQLRTELAELRQQHRTELDTFRAENRAEREELRGEHREQLTDLRMLARTTERRAEEHRDRADRASPPRRAITQRGWGRTTRRPSSSATAQQRDGA